jgi:uncharacterized protein (DUF2062 family)
LRFICQKFGFKSLFPRNFSRGCFFNVSGFGEKRLINFLGRKNAARAAAVGLFCAWIPIPFQMILAASLAIFFSANIPLSVALVWLTNPITMPPLFYAAYRLGAWVLQMPVNNFAFELSFRWLAEVFNTTAINLGLKAYFLGTLAVGVFLMFLDLEKNV